MKQSRQIEQDLASIRNLMERSEKFISLAGLSGILAGFYALIGATAAYYLIYYPASPLGHRVNAVRDTAVLQPLLAIAAAVLAASLLTGFYLSYRKARKHQTRLWNTTSKKLVINLTIPLVTGGLFTLILINAGYYGIAAPACLIFYGLGLINASGNLYEEVRYLGYSEIVLGLMNALLPGYGLIFWAVGFGLLHIAYGTVMHYRYDR